MPAFEFIINLIVYSAFVPVGLFIYFYGTKPWRGHKFLRRPSTLWRTTAVGRTLMYKSMGWFVYLLFVSASIIFEDWPGRVYLRGAIYVAIVMLFWRLFFVLRQAQKKRPKDPSTTGLTSDVENTQDLR